MLDKSCRRLACRKICGKKYEQEAIFQFHRSFVFGFDQIPECKDCAIFLYKIIILISELQIFERINLKAALLRYTNLLEMWNLLVRFILRDRLAILIAIGLLTIFMGWKGSNVKMSYDFARMLPANDTVNVVYEKFKETFGQDGSVMFVGVQDEHLFDLERFVTWHDLTEKVRAVNGVEEVVSIGRMYTLVRNDERKKFDFKPLIEKMPDTQEQLDSLKNHIYNLPFYDGLLFNKDSNVSMMMITLDKKVLNSKNRIGVVSEIKNTLDTYTEKFNVPLHYSGLPYIRTITSQKIQHELILFTFLAIGIAFGILYAFFRSAGNMGFIILIVIITVIFMFGLMGIFGYRITILTGILPALMIVIGVENSIFLLNKYYGEFLAHGNKVKALSRVIRSIGSANFLTNATTAAGFASFVITRNEMLVQFGIIAAINIFVAYLLSLFLIPIIFSYLPPPKPKHYQHFEKGNINHVLKKIAFVVVNRRNAVYFVTISLAIAGVIGISLLKTTGNVVDDISHKEQLYKDLMFFEKHFKGVMPFEISIDTHKKKGILRASTIQKIEQLQDSLARYPQMSKPLSIVEIVKFAKQGFFNGDPAFYSLPNNQERNFILSYIPDFKSDKRTILNSFVDTTLQQTRISVQLANVNTRQIDSIEKSLIPVIDSIFNPSDFTVTRTGTSLVFLKGTNYLVNNLISSLMLAMAIIALLMALRFSSFKMIVISMIPNLFPQLLTAAMMGYVGIPIKPSTILIFSVALGISVDNTIHFLSRYRQQLKIHHWKIHESVIGALLETGFSMIYTAIVLFCGFAIFTLSSFGGTVALGFLVSFTLLVAVLANLFLLPSLLLTFDKWGTRKSFTEPILEMPDEDDETPIEGIEKDQPTSSLIN